jgi:hypothetical protein
MHQSSDISQHGLLLLAHTNYTMIKFFMAFKKTNVMLVTKTASLCNNIISFSKDQLKQTKGLDILISEKEELRNNFNVEKHHFVVAINIFMYLSRHNLIAMDVANSQGKKFQWNEDRTNRMIDSLVPDI